MIVASNELTSSFTTTPIITIIIRKLRRHSQSTSKITDESLRVLKKEGNYFHNEVWVAFILELLKLSELAIQISLQIKSPKT